MKMRSLRAFIEPEWPKPDNVTAIITTRHHHDGGSIAPYENFNLATHVGDSRQTVLANRRRLAQEAAVKAKWLTQIHSNNIVCLDQPPSNFECDASYTRQQGIACSVLTADCLPVFLCDSRGEQVMCLHAGWRGLANGILSRGAALFPKQAKLLAYLGPAISVDHFEVGEEVKAAFKLAERQQKYSQPTAKAFRPSERQGKYFADLYQLARFELQGAGVSAVYGGEFCTFSQPERFYSYRRDGATGRFASLIWRNKQA